MTTGIQTGSVAMVRSRWNVVDVAVMTYTAAVAVFVVLRFQVIPEWTSILVTHALILFGVALLPPRGSAWEIPPIQEPAWRKVVRGGARFLRYTYPLALVIYFFEEVAYTVNALWLDTPYWFEPYLYAADRFVFGDLPALLMSGWTGFVQDEIMHGFYFSYYFIIIGGAVLAWVGAKGASQREPGPGLETVMASTLFAYLLTFLWYPLFPSRGPWENPEVMAGLPAFQGYIFTPIIEFIIKNGAVSGGCFPSSHVAGSWGMVLGLAKHHRRAAWWMGLVAAGLSFSCVYTRYHHAVDILAGFTMAVIGTWLARRLVR